MRTAFPFLVLIIAGTACGDSASPVPPATASAASVAVLAGDGQSVPAGEPAPVSPAVVVLDQDGRPFRGATVRFSVTDGGGTLQGGTQTTDASGVARVASWTMGNTGPQRVAAAVGSLSPASIEATIIPGTEITAEVVPPTGGVVTISTAGHPYEGLRLDVPPGTFPASVDMRLRLAPNAQPPSMPAGYRVGGPLLEITTDAPRGGEWMELEVPIVQQPGEAAVLVYYDPARRVMEVLPTVSRTDTSVRVVTAHLRADLLLGPAPASSSPPAGAQGLGSVTGHLMPVIHSMVQPPVAQLYDPSTSGWPVVDHGSAALPDGFGSTIPAVQVMTSNLGVSPTSIVRGLDTPGFYADAGILAAVQAAAHTPGITSSQMAALFSKFAGLTKATRDEYVSQNLTASLALLNKPGFAALFNSTTGPTPDATWFATTVGSSTGGLSLSQAAEPATGTLGHSANGFDNVLVKQAGDGPTTSVDGALPMSSFVFDYTKTSPVIETLKKFEGLSLDQRRIMNDEVRDLFGLARPTFETEAVPGMGYTTHPGGPFIMRGDVFNLRVAGGEFGLSIHDVDPGAPPGPAPVSTHHVGTNQALDFVTFEGLPGVGVNLGFIDPTQSLVRSIVSLNKHLLPLVKQLAPEPIDVVRAPFKATPDTAFIGNDSTVTFWADVPSPPTEGFRIRWEWGDGTTSENVGTMGGMHRYDPPDQDYTVTVTLLSADGSQVLASDTVQVKGSKGIPYWRLTSITDADGLGSDASLPLTVLLADAVANPGSAMISVDEGLQTNSSILRLRVLAGGTWDINNCCARRAPLLPGETRQALGYFPAFYGSSYGPLFNGYDETFLTGHRGDLDVGTMAGQYPIGAVEYWVWNPVGEGQEERQQGPEFVLRVNATRNGTAMTGTITLFAWPTGDPLPGSTVRLVETTPDSWPFPFTAERIR